MSEFKSAIFLLFGNFLGELGLVKLLLILPHTYLVEMFFFHILTIIILWVAPAIVHGLLDFFVHHGVVFKRHLLLVWTLCLSFSVECFLLVLDFQVHLFDRTLADLFIAYLTTVLASIEILLDDLDGGREVQANPNIEDMLIVLLINRSIIRLVELLEVTLKLSLVRLACIMLVRHFSDSSSQFLFENLLRFTVRQTRIQWCLYWSS